MNFAAAHMIETMLVGGSRNDGNSCCPRRLPYCTKTHQSPSEGGRRPSALSPGQAVPTGGLGLGERWSVGCKGDVVLRLLLGEATEMLSRELGVLLHRLVPMS
jgi:hypothetical protein